MKGQESSPLTRLVLVIIALAVVGSCLSMILVVFVEQPRMNTLQPPENSGENNSWDCKIHCYDVMAPAMILCNFDSACERSVNEDYESCLAQCG
jgi:hypothetical protein